MAKGSLYGTLHKSPEVPSWERRKTMLQDACRGVAYLHAESPPLVHQSSNILVDENYVAKLCDFGVAVDLPQIKEGMTMVTAPLIARTEGYFPPELTSGKFSPKSDVYSYGVVVLEAFCGLKAFVKDRSDPKLTEYTEDDRKTLDSFLSIHDSRMESPSIEMAETFFEIVNKSTMRHSKRPSSAEVLVMWDM